MKKLLLILNSLLIISTLTACIDAERYNRLMVEYNNIELENKILEQNTQYYEDYYITEIIYIEYYEKYTFKPIRIKAKCDYMENCYILEN